MKKYLSVWSLVSVLILSASANAAELSCTTANPTCASIGYTYTTAQATANLELNRTASALNAWDCTACSLDASKWACVNKKASLSNNNGSGSSGGSSTNACAGYTLSKTTVDRTYSNGGYNCSACPTNSSLYKCTAKLTCPTGFSISRDYVCTLPRVVCTNTGQILSDGKPYYKCGGGAIPACNDGTWLAQQPFSSRYCSQASGLYVNYRCINGYRGTEPCFSSYTVQYREGAPEPCKALYGIEPDDTCKKKFGQEGETIYYN